MSDQPEPDGGFDWDGYREVTEVARLMYPDPPRGSDYRTWRKVEDERQAYTTGRTVLTDELHEAARAMFNHVHAAAQQAGSADEDDPSSFDEDSEVREAYIDTARLMFIQAGFHVDDSQ